MSCSQVPLSYFTVSWDLVGNRERLHDSMEPIRCPHKHDSVKWFRFAVEIFPVSTAFDFQSPKTGGKSALRAPTNKGIDGNLLRTYVRRAAGISVVPALLYVRTRLFAVKPVYIRSCDCFNPHKAPHPPSGRVGHVVAVFQIVLVGIGNHKWNTGLWS